MMMMSVSHWFFCTTVLSAVLRFFLIFRKKIVCGCVHDKLTQYAFILLQYVASLMSSAAFLVSCHMCTYINKITVCNSSCWQIKYDWWLIDYSPYCFFPTATVVVMVFIINYSFKQWLVSCSEQINDCWNVIGTISIALAAPQVELDR